MSIDFSGGSFADDPYYSSTGPYSNLSGDEWINAVQGSSLWNAVNNPAYNQANANPDPYGAYPYSSVTSGASGTTGGGGGGGGFNPYAAYDAQRQMNAIATVKALLNQYGLSALYSKIEQYIKEGYDGDTVMVLIRTTPEYKARFPAMEALAQKGRAINEATYIDYEKTASTLERRYGLPTGMLMGKVTDLLTNEVSSSELNDRVILASAASIEAPQELKDTFSRYYNLDQGAMTAYFLDPDVATPLLEKQYASARIGREAEKQGIGIDVYGAENLQNLGITTEQARQGFGQVAAATELTSGRGDVVSQKELIAGTLGGEEKARQSIERAAQSRTGRFQGGGGFAPEGRGGTSGLGTSTTQ